MNFLQITNFFPTERLSPSGHGLLGLYYADIGEAVTYCPECAEREFGALHDLKESWRSD